MPPLAARSKPQLPRRSGETRGCPRGSETPFPNCKCPNGLRRHVRFRWPACTPPPGALERWPQRSPDANSGKSGGLAAMDRHKRWRLVGKGVILGVGLLTGMGAMGCLDGHRPQALTENSPREFVQEGTALVRDGEETQVGFKSAFQTPPRLEVMGFVQSWFKDEPYSKNS